MDYDTVLEHVGEMGLYQIVMIILLVLCPFYNSTQTFALNVIAPHHDHICDVTGGSGQYSYFELLQVAPVNPKSGSSDSCRMLDLDWTNTTVEEVSLWNRTLLELHPTVACHKWVFNTEQYANTFTSEWSAVCGNDWLRQIFTNTYQGGLLVGSIISGQLADRNGRKTTLVILAFFAVILGVSCVFDPEMISYLILRFLYSITIRGIELTSFVLISETLSSKWTAYAGIMTMFIFTLGGLSIAGIGFAISDFRLLQLVLVPLPLLMLSYYLLVHESPKWLLTQGRYEEVAQFFKRAAKFNRKPYPEVLVNQYLKEVKQKAEAESIPNHNLSITRIFKADLRKTTLILNLNWVAVVLIYSAFTMSMSELAGSVYVNITIACVLEIPGLIASVFIIRRFGRKWPVVGGFVLTALMNFIIVPLQLFPDLASTVTILSLVCRAASASVYGMFYLYGALLYPTEIRQIALGTAIATGSAFGLAAPYIAGPVANVWTPLPNIIFGLVAVSASVATVFLPEFYQESVGTSEQSQNDHMETDHSSVPVVSSAYAPCASCVRTDRVYPITKIPAEEDIAIDEYFKHSVKAIQFKDIDPILPKENYIKESYIEDTYM